MVYSTLSSNESNQAKINKIFDNIHLINWSKYQLIIGVHNNISDLLEFLEKNYTEAAEKGKLNFFRATANVDGLYADGYSSIIGSLFVNDMKGTIHIISKLDTALQKKIAYLIVYSHAHEDREKFENDIDLLKVLNINTKERS